MIDELQLPTSVQARAADIHIRRATSDDLEAVTRLLGDDAISTSRGDGISDANAAIYAAALQRIIDSPGNELIVALDSAGAVVGMLQLTVIPGLSHRGRSRLLVEAVRVSSAERSSGIGGALMRWVMDRATRETGAPLVQLTSHGARTDAHRFYTRLGFADSHLGFKYDADQGAPAEHAG